MAPRTYGKKKRSLFKAFSSRRAQRTVASAVVGDSQGPVSPATGVHRTTGGSRNRAARHSNSLDEIASALLDDTNYQGDVGSLVSSTERDTVHVPSSRSMPMARGALAVRTLDGIPVSPLAMHAVFARTPSPAARRISPSRIEKSPPRKQRRPLAQSSTSENRPGSLAQTEAARAVRSSSQSVKSPFDDSHEDNDGAEPFPAFDENNASARPQPGSQPAAAYVIDADEVERKVAAMLAATEALKPKSPQTRDTPASKVSRMVPSVLAKVSSAWGRLSSRPSTPEPTEAAKLRKEAARETTRLIPTSRTTPNIMAPAGRSSIDSLALRRNEGANLNKRKIQKILGGSFTPKLSSGSRKSLRTDQALDVSCGEPIEPQIPSDAEIWRMFFGTDDADDDDGQLHDDKTPSPFGSEVGFEENLEDRILHTAPTGSSTPRVGSSSPHVDSPLKSSNDSDTKSVYPSEEGSLPSDVQVKVAEVAVKLGDDEAKTTIREVDVKPSSSVKNGKATTNSQRRVMPVAHGRIEAIKQDDRQKKHPSPSKQELEVLEQALQWVPESSKPATPILVVRDRNRLMLSRSSSVRGPDPLAEQSPLSARDSRIPRPVRIPKRHPNVRLAPAFRPTTARPGEVDELL